MRRIVAIVVYACLVHGRIGSDEGNESDLDESSEHLGPVVTQVYRHPYAASILHNEVYECTATVLNRYWLVTLTKCFDKDLTSSYTSRHPMKNYTVRVGSSYNFKRGYIHKIKTLVNNFDLKVSAVKLETPLVFGDTVQAVTLPQPEEDAYIGYLASIIAWTPDGHMRVVNAPVIQSSICEDNTKLLPGHYVCLGGVQDANRNFCRKDNGGAVIQNNTLVAIATFYQTCALYTRAHAFPKASSFSRWLSSVIWDEDAAPTSSTPPSTISSKPPETTEPLVPTNSFYVDPSKFMLTLPYDTVNLPLEPAEDNSVLPKISLYESYLQNLAKMKTSTTEEPAIATDNREWLKKYGKAVMMMPAEMAGKRYQPFEY